MTCPECNNPITVGAVSCPVCFTWFDAPLVSPIPESLEKPPNERELEYVRQYIRNGGKARPAAIAAGYGPGTAHTAACTWIKATREDSVKPHLWDIVEHEQHRIIEVTDITEDRIELELARLAFFDPSKMFDKHGAVKSIHDMDEDTRRAIGGVDIGSRLDEDGMLERIMKIKVAEKKGSLEALARIRGMNTDKVRVELGFGSLLKEISRDASSESLVIEVAEDGTYGYEQEDE